MAPQVEVVHWNPLRRRRRTFAERVLGRHPAAPVDNFGDLLGPVVVERLLRERGLVPDDGMPDEASVHVRSHTLDDDGDHAAGHPLGAGNQSPHHADGHSIDAGRGPARRLLAVGSILHLARDGDVVWGSGVNGKVPLAELRARHLDVRAVRGPRTREVLASLGIAAPAVYGDPALLLPLLDPRLRAWAAEPVHDLTVVPNVHDLPAYRGHPAVIAPTAPLDVVLERIARSRLVVGSSLHGLVVAESLGIPARAVVARREDPFKYDDYYRGTGRDGFHPAASVEEAVRLGGEEPLQWEAGPLLTAFPTELWNPAPGVAPGVSGATATATTATTATTPAADGRPGEVA